MMKFSLLRRHGLLSRRFLSILSAVTSENVEKFLSIMPLKSPGFDIAQLWKNRISLLARSSSRGLIELLGHDNELCYDFDGPLPKKGTLMEFILAQKKMHPEKIVLTRVGEFYESYGLDAIMLVEHAGLNPMSGKPRAGCRVSSIQSTLDNLTSAGLSVAVYEEVQEADLDVQSLKKIKKRVLSQVVSPASPTYLFDLCLKNDDVDFKDTRPFMGVMKLSNSYSLWEVFIDSRTVHAYDQLTEEGLMARLESQGLTEPLFLQGIQPNQIKAIAIDRFHIFSSESHESFLARMLTTLEAQFAIPAARFRTIRKENLDRPMPLYVPTAQQIGIIDNPHVPCLIDALLPSSFPQTYSNRFLRRWLLTPPPYAIASAMRDLCRIVSIDHVSIPIHRPVAAGKVVSLITARQCNAAVFRDIYENVAAMLIILGVKMSRRGGVWIDEPDGGNGVVSNEKMISSLLTLTSYECGIEANKDELISSGLRGLRLIRDVISFTSSSSKSDKHSLDPSERIPEALFERSESFRNIVNKSSPRFARMYNEIQSSVDALCKCIESDVPANIPIIYDAINEIIVLKSKPASLNSRADDSDEAEDVDVSKVTSKLKKQPIRTNNQSVSPSVVYFHAMDRNGKEIPNRFTCQSLSDSLSAYKDKVNQATGAIKRELQKLSEELESELISIIQASHLSLIIQTVCAHASSSLQKGWCIPNVSADNRQMEVTDMIPYWLSRSQAVPNSFQMNGIYLLTAPNMSGKSTFMRSAMVTALLGNVGLFVPAKHASIPLFENFFLRAASYDNPVEGKSALAIEIDDIRVMFRDGSKKSLVMVDELGRGTSTHDGTALAGAVLERMSQLDMTGIFSTHLHELFNLPLVLSGTTQKKRMKMSKEPDGSMKWNYELEDGECHNSYALETAKKFGLPEIIISRAFELGAILSNAQSSSSSTRPQSFIESPLQVITPLAAAATVMSGTEGSEAKSISFDELWRKSHSILLSCSGCSSIVTVEAEYEPPASLEGFSVVYLIALRPSSGSKVQSVQFYVGETESIRQRLKQHRDNKAMYHVACKAAAAPNKTAARMIETLLINALKNEGFALLNDKDGSHTLFSQSSHS